MYQLRGSQSTEYDCIPSESGFLFKLIWEDYMGISGQAV